MIINGVTVKNKTVAGEFVKYLLSMGLMHGSVWKGEVGKGKLEMSPGLRD